VQGRLIQAFLAEFYRLDTVTTRSSDHYDDDFGEVTRTDSDGDGIGEVQRSDHAAVKVPCQIARRTFEGLQAHDMGNVPQSDLVLWLHFNDLERLSLVADNGLPLIHTGDRLSRILEIGSEALVMTIRTPPGLYVTDATASGWGLCMAQPTRNLLRVQLSERSAV